MMHFGWLSNLKVYDDSSVSLAVSKRGTEAAPGVHQGALHPMQGSQRVRQFTEFSLSQAVQRLTKLKKKYKTSTLAGKSVHTAIIVINCAVIVVVF